jgi:GntR family transcriptional regulator, transcriptional repressor for pyruvate dehydrogenase complex
MTLSAPDRARRLAVLPRERLVDRAIEAIKTYMIASALQAGDRLPSEADLAQSLSVSRNVVRQALSSLEAVGIVRTEHGRGTFVAEMGASSNILQHLAFWLDIDRLSQDEYIDARATFEVGALLRVMQRATDADFKRLSELVTQLEQATNDDERHHFHDAFHRALLEATHNRFLAPFGLILYRFFWGLASHAPGVTNVPVAQMPASHQALLHGLMTRDEALLPSLVAMHLGSATPEDILEPRMGSNREVTG